MSMYPSLEDMEVHKLSCAQAASQQHTVVQQQGGVRIVGRNRGDVFDAFLL